MLIVHRERDTENWSNAIIGNVFLETVLNDKIILS